MHLKPRSPGNLISGAALVLLCAVPIVPQQLVTNNQTPIVVELSAKKSVVYPGEMLTFHVVIKNQGTSPLYIPRDISEINQRFVLSLRYGSKKEGSGSMAVGDTFFPPGEVPPFAKLLSTQWIVLDPGMYGCDIEVYANEFPRLRVPGTYYFTGRYASHGFHENLRGFEQDTGKLPFKAWEGEVETNSVKIVVTRAAK